MQSGREADDLLAEAVAHEEHRVLGDVGHERRRGALVEAAQADLFIGGHDAVDEAPVQSGEGLHLDFGCVQRLPAEDTRGSSWERKHRVRLSRLL